MNVENGVGKITKNTIMLYFRQVLILIVNLYMVRVALQVLGEEDYGIYNLVAGIVTMFSVLSGSMSSASQRFFSFYIGKNDSRQLRKSFSMSINIYILISILVVVITETIGLWYVKNILVIPSQRFSAAIIIYHSTIFSLIFTMIAVPFMSLVIANEDMNIYAYVSVVETILKLGAVFILKIFNTDKLVLYGVLNTTVSVLITLIYQLICKKKYEESRYCFLWDHQMFKNIFEYTGWNLLGSSVSAFKNQAVNVVLNQAFNPLIITARGIAASVNSAVMSFSQNFSTAVRPQIIKQYASGNYKAMNTLVFSSSKGTYLLMYLITLPFCLEAKFVLSLWLGNVPDYAIIFTRMALIDALIESMSYPIMALVAANGKIRLYQGVVGGIQLLNLPLTYILITMNGNPVDAYLVAVCLTGLALLARILIASKLTEFSARSFFNQVMIKVFMGSIVAALIPFFFCIKMQDNIFRFLVIGVSSVIGIIISAWWIVFDSREKKWILQMVKSKFRVKL